MSTDALERAAFAEPDRKQINELVEVLRDARDRAHWLAVYRRMKLARHVEQALELCLRITYDLQGRHARGEPR